MKLTSALYGVPTLANDVCAARRQELHVPQTLNPTVNCVGTFLDAGARKHKYRVAVTGDAVEVPKQQPSLRSQSRGIKNNLIS